MDNIESLVFINSRGERVELSTPSTVKWWELRGRTGFTAPDVEIISQKYANGVTRILKRILKPRPVSVRMVVTGDTTAERDAAFFDMISKLMDVTGGDTGKLYVMRSDGVEVYLNCVYSSGASITEQYRKLHTFTLEFYAADPYFYRDVPSEMITVPLESLLVLKDGLTLGGHTLGETSNHGDGIVSNGSTEVLQPVLKVVGISGSITISNVTSGQTLTLTGVAIPSGSTLVIDTRDESKDIYILASDGTTSPAGQYLDWENLDFDFDILPGNNSITFEVTVGSYTEGVLFEMAERYLSA